MIDNFFKDGLAVFTDLRIFFFDFGVINKSITKDYGWSNVFGLFNNI